MTSQEQTVREIATGRIATIRLAPNQDVVEGLENAAAQSGFAWSIVRGAVGSLIDATILTQAGERTIVGPGVEMLSLSGELVSGRSDGNASMLTALVGGTDGSAIGGRLVRGRNLVCATLEVALEEIVDDRAGARS